MKKVIILLLVFSLLTLTSCGLFQKDEPQTETPKEENTPTESLYPKGTEDICETANKSKSTKITTEVTFVTNAGDRLIGYYVTTTDGESAIFEYYFERFATPAESIESGNSDRIVSFEGVINYHNGVYFGDEEDWKPGSGTAFDLKFNVDPALLKDIVVNEDGNELEAKVSPENLVLLIGTNLNAVGDATVSISTNSVNLTTFVVNCTTANGTMTVRSSFTYNPQELFPEVEDETTEDTTEDENNENTETAE